MTVIVFGAGWAILLVLAGSGLIAMFRRRHEPVSVTAAPSGSEPQQQQRGFVDQLKTTWFNYWGPAIIGAIVGILVSVIDTGNAIYGVLGPFLLSNALLWFSSACLIPRSVSPRLQFGAFSVFSAIFFGVLVHILG